jgi:beta-glucosidase
LWGSATSSHQVEGNNTKNDWWAWEQTRPQHTRSGRAADHWNRFEEDFKAAQELGHNAHRFSIEWSRIEPQEGQWDQAALDHYAQVIHSLRAKGHRAHRNPVSFHASFMACQPRRMGRRKDS